MEIDILKARQKINDYITNSNFSDFEKAKQDLLKLSDIKLKKILFLYINDPFYLSGLTLSHNILIANCLKKSE